MKLSEMNSRQKLVAKLAWDRCGWVVGGYENTMQDEAPESEDYKGAKAALADHEGLVAEIYDELMSWTDKGYLKHLRFVGKAFILERIDRRLKSWGY